MGDKKVRAPGSHFLNAPINPQIFMARVMPMITVQAMDP
jgi:hypothetical protein